MKWVVVTETNQPWSDWAGKNQFLLWSFAERVEIANGTSLAGASAKLQDAAKKAGTGGLVILSVGHGGLATTGDGLPDEGFFDLAPGGAFRVAGNNAVLTGQTGGGKKAHVSVFYDFVPTNAVGKPKSRKQEDEERAKSSNPQVANAAKTRLAHWEHYLKFGEALRANGVVAVLLLTCKVGLANEFLKRVRTQLGVPIAAYKRRVFGNHVEYLEGQRVVARRARLFLEGDSDGVGTNIQMGEFWFPSPPASNWTVLP